MSSILTNCPLCEGQQHEQIYLAKDRHYGISGLYRYVRCVECSLVFLNPMFSAEELGSLYPTDYYSYQDNSRRSRWKDLLRTALHFHVQTLDPKFPAPGKMLDLGCGSGWFMLTMQAQGWETHGVEISAAAAELGHKSSGLNIFSGTLDQANYPSEFFDYVRSNHSFEHISCPSGTLNEIHRILKPGGKVLIGVPNIDSLNAKLFQQYWWYLGAPVHPFNYSAQTLSRLLQKHQFNIQQINYNSDFSGILGSIQIFLNRANGNKSSQGWLINNPLLKVPSHWAAKLIDLFRLGDAIEIVAIKRGSTE
ncbi:MAG TPA: class I SAM-dependent methyltransferase [Terriglobales bacterium]|nr:class I SAM-dependent methyltransferase [Terriglobales bacterium]